MLGVVAAIFVVAFFFWILRRKKRFSYLKELGIPGPEPNFLFGNQLEIAKKTPLVCHKEWAKKYGKVFGYYMGTRPIVAVADAELLKKIQVSEFQKFVNKPKMYVFESRKPKTDDGLSYQITYLRDKRWKEIRSLLTPSFTTSKMKLMAPIINKAVDTLLEKIEEKSQKNESFDIYNLYQALTMDIIGRTAFGIQTDCQNDPDDPFLRSARALFGGKINNWMTLLSFSFPVRRFWRFVVRYRMLLRNKGLSPDRLLIDAVSTVIKERRSDETKRRPDLLQLMIDTHMSKDYLSRVTGKDLTAGEDENQNTGIGNKEEHKLQKNMRSMQDHEILHNAIFFFLAGYETTSASLAFVSHFLVHYQDLQENVREELMDLIKREGELSYSSVKKLQYLDQVITESLRMYPPVYLFVNREAGEDVKLGNFVLKKGLPIQIPAHLIHRDKDYWPEPDIFDPDRFSPENKEKNNPFAFQAFGNGPRNCVGMRFAQMEEKLALAKILSKYRLVPCEQTEKLDLSLKASVVSITPRNGVHLKAVPL